MKKEGHPKEEPMGTNKEQIFDLIQGHPEGIDDDLVSELSGVRPRQQVQQICNQLADADRIRRESISKVGKRRKIHNFPIPEQVDPLGGADSSWRRRLANLVAVTGKSEEELLDEALQGLAVKVLRLESTVSASED